MKILFLDNSPRWIYGLPNGFKDIGYEVEILKTLNENNIINKILEFKPNLIMAIGWKNKFEIEAIKNSKKYIVDLKIPYIYWSTEDPGYTHIFTFPFIQKTKPNFIFTICPEKVLYYEKLGIKSNYLGFGYHESIHYKEKNAEKYKSQIAVVANAYPNLLSKYPKNFRLKSIKTLIEPLLKENIKIDFWGEEWDGMGKVLGFDIPSQCIHGPISYVDANKIYSSSEIVIGIQNQEKHSQLCQRTYEILGSEGFLLTSDTKTVREKFQHGNDLIVSSSPEETIKLVKYYLNNPKERERIKKNGKNTVEKYSYKHRAEYIIDILKKRNIL